MHIGHRRSCTRIKCPAGTQKSPESGVDLVDWSGKGDVAMSDDMHDPPVAKTEWERASVDLHSNE